MVHASLCSRRLWRDRRPCPPGRDRRSGPGPRRSRDRHPCRQPQSDRLQIVRGDERVSKYQLPRPFGFDASGVVLSAARGPPNSSRAIRSMRARRATPSARSPSRSRCREKLVALKPATISHAEAAALPLVGLTTLQGFGARRGARRPAHSDPRRLRRGRHLRGSVREASRASRHLDHEFEECRFRQIARRRQGHRLRPRKLSRTGRRLRYRLRHARRRVHGRCLQGGEARRRRDLAERPARSRFRPARGRGLAGPRRGLADEPEGLCRERGGRRCYCWFFTEPDGDQLREIAGLVDGGAIRPVIDREFAFEQLPAALTYLEAGRARGKVVLKVK